MQTSMPAGQAPIRIGATATAPVPTPNLPPSLLDKPAGQARVTLNNGSLAVDANNSSLSEILKNIEGSTGMTVDGFDKDSRVFGIYGPGSPRDVLSALLDGAGYNFLMVGATSAGTPRAVVLTTRNNAPIAAAAPGGNAQPDEDDEPNYPPPGMEQAPPLPVPPPQANPPMDQRPRTPQEMLQELQRLRQQQQQPQPGQPNPQ